MARTPTPWSRHGADIHGAHRECVAQFWTMPSEQDAALMIEAVNSYASLRAKLEIAEKALAEFLECCEQHPAFTKRSNVITTGRVDAARAALTAIREGRE